MKTFYTERDIVDMHAAGIRQLETHDGVVLTDLAREKAEALGVALVPINPSPTSPPAQSGSDNAALIAKIKARVVSRLGTTEYDDLLDQVIPQVLARLRN